MSFNDRMAAAHAHEQATASLLRAHGWEVCDFGQGQLTPTMRTALRRLPAKCLLRWMPDLLAVRSPEVVLVDAKTSTRHDTPNYDIEKASHAAHHQWMATFGVPIAYVWFDFKVSVLTEIGQQLKPGTFQGNGSGTPFWLIPKTTARDFSDVFGPRHDEPIVDEWAS